MRNYLEEFGEGNLLKLLHTQQGHQKNCIKRQAYAWLPKIQKNLTTNISFSYHNRATPVEHPSLAGLTHNVLHWSFEVSSFQMEKTGILIRSSFLRTSLLIVRTPESESWNNRYLQSLCKRFKLKDHFSKMTYRMLSFVISPCDPIRYIHMCMKGLLCNRWFQTVLCVASLLKCTP